MARRRLARPAQGGWPEEHCGRDAVPAVRHARRRARDRPGHRVSHGGWRQKVPPGAARADVGGSRPRRDRRRRRSRRGWLGGRRRGCAGQGGRARHRRRGHARGPPRGQHRAPLHRQHVRSRPRRSFRSRRARRPRCTRPGLRRV